MLGHRGTVKWRLRVIIHC
ncbi:hypothetical protein Gogos_020208 [Gossypium gossypioides]|uniref:Uncharacterized protein n=1 Tax=Gossypium gossypioides TaxID=34282 RepID=A0A7J9CXP9_GOSGO|nr:hypothetical protein [Gossypium gossypioides]